MWKRQNDSERDLGRKHHWTRLFVEEGQQRRETKRGSGTTTEGKRGDERILIWNLENKIIRLSDSKCQHRKGSRWKEGEGEREREIREEGREGTKTFRGRQVGLEEWRHFLSMLPSGRRKIVFLMWRHSIFPGKIVPICQWGETEPPGQAGESSYEGGCLCVCTLCVASLNLWACTLTHSLFGWEKLPLSQPWLLFHSG